MSWLPSKDHRDYQDRLLPPRQVLRLGLAALVLASSFIVLGGNVAGAISGAVIGVFFIGLGLCRMRGARRSPRA